MTKCAGKLKEDGRWIAAELNNERYMLVSLASKLSSDHSLARIFQEAQINLSFFGFGLTASGTAPITDIEASFSKMLSFLRKLTAPDD